MVTTNGGWKMTEQLQIPIISVEGSPRERGVQYGSQARTIIERILEGYRKALKDRLNLEWNQALDLSKKFLPAIEPYDPEVIVEMQGIAEGAGRSFEEILLINARSELIFLARAGGLKALGSPETAPEGCTVMAATPEVTKNGHMIVGHNVDWMPGSEKNYVILKKKKKEGLNFVSMLEAGIVGKSGFNAAGIVAFGNALITDRMKFGVPVQIIANKVLSADSVADACTYFLPPNRGSALNRLIADEKGLCINVEMAPESFNYLFPEDGVLVHTNHFVVPNPKITDMNVQVKPDTLLRRHRAFQLLSAERGRITVDAFKTIFRDHRGYHHSVCQHVDQKHPEAMRTQTVLSNIYDVNERKLYIALGPPCEHDYVELDFSDMLRS
jgi:isopenicillin-N N-acyltransferase-like protein